MSDVKKYHSGSFSDQPEENKAIVPIVKQFEQFLKKAKISLPVDTQEAKMRELQVFLSSETGLIDLSVFKQSAEQVYTKTGGGVRLTKTHLSEGETIFLFVYGETLSKSKALALSGLNRARINGMMASNTLFGVMFRTLVKNIEKHPAVDKASAMDKLLDLQEKVEEQGDFKTALAIQKEINKMVAGNIAPTQSLNHTVTDKRVEVIDLTKK